LHFKPPFGLIGFNQNNVISVQIKFTVDFMRGLTGYSETGNPVKKEPLKAPTRLYLRAD